MKAVAKSIYRFCFLFFPTSAVAEVCDKEVPDWNLVSGPVGQFEYMIQSALSVQGVSIFVFLALGLLVRKPWSAVLAFAVTAFYIYAILDIWYARDGIFAASIAEGCRASPIPILAFLTITSAGFLVVSVKRYSSR